MAPIRPSTALRLPLRRSTTSHHPQSQCLLQINQTRHSSSNRRARKESNIAPAAGMGGPSLPMGATGRSRTARAPLPAGDHIVYNPPPSMPNPYHTPPKFLPKSDVRWKLFEQQQQQAQSASSPASTTSSKEPFDPLDPRLPTPVHTPYQKKYHMGPKEIEEMRALRQSDEETWTRTKLAEKFKCTQWFAGMVVQASDARHKKLKADEESWKEWARRKNPALLKIKEDRLKRKALWTHEV